MTDKGLRHKELFLHVLHSHITIYKTSSNIYLICKKSNSTLNQETISSVFTMNKFLETEKFGLTEIDKKTQEAKKHDTCRAGNHHG